MQADSRATAHKGHGEKDRDKAQHVEGRTHHKRASEQARPPSKEKASRMPHRWVCARQGCACLGRVVRLFVVLAHTGQSAHSQRVVLALTELWGCVWCFYLGRSLAVLRGSVVGVCGACLMAVMLALTDLWGLSAGFSIQHVNISGTLDVGTSTVASDYPMVWQCYYLSWPGGRHKK